jgi:hypothetical protein
MALAFAWGRIGCSMFVLVLVQCWIGPEVNAFSLSTDLQGLASSQYCLKVSWSLRAKKDKKMLGLR